MLRQGFEFLTLAAGGWMCAACVDGVRAEFTRFLGGSETHPTGRFMEGDYL